MDERFKLPPNTNTNLFMFTDHSVSRGGYLPDFEVGAHACWYYCICAHQNLQSAAEGAVYEGEMDTVPALKNIAISIAIQYRFEDPGEFLSYMSVVTREADRCGMGWDPRVLAPWLADFQKTMS